MRDGIEVLCIYGARVDELRAISICRPLPIVILAAVDSHFVALRDPTARNFLGAGFQAAITGRNTSNANDGDRLAQCTIGQLRRLGLVRCQCSRLLEAFSVELKRVFPVGHEIDLSCIKFEVDELFGRWPGREILGFEMIG